MTLYHYTSIETVHSILEKISENGYLTFWATHSFYMNDPWEYKLFAEHLKNQVVEYGKNNDDEVSENELEECFSEKNLFYLAPFIISFSTKEDDLDMWRAYGKNGSGVCLEFYFDDEILEADNMHLNSKQQLNPIDMSLLKYHDIKDCKYINNERPEIDKNKIAEIHRKIKSKKQFDDIATSRFIYLEAPVYKHGDYKSECEVRIIKMGELGKEKYRISGNGLMIPYIEIKIPVACLKKIIVMPAPNNLQLKSLTRYLYKPELIKYKIEVENSKIPYRPNL